MSVKKKGNDWHVDIRPWGEQGKRVRRKFRTKAEAIRFESHLVSKATADKDWNPTREDNRQLNELIEIWKREHGVTLVESWRYETYLTGICDYLNNPIARKIKTEDINRWKAWKLESTKPNSVNTQLQWIKALFNWLEKNGHIDYKSPALKSAKIKVQEKERPYLNKEQIQKLYQAFETHHDKEVTLIAQTCLETGCRWSEAQNLKKKDVREGRVTFINTKGKKIRSIPVSVDLFAKLKAWPNDSFRKCEHTGRNWLNELLELPAGISSHILRHTFASWFVINGGNILTLQKILGHAKIDMTMRYAHLAPDHLEDAIKYSPKNILDNNWT